MLQERFHKLTEGEARSLWESGLIPTTTYVLLIIKCHGKAGWKWSTSSAEFLKTWGVKETEFLEAIARLIELRLINAIGDKESLRLWHLYPNSYNEHLDSPYWAEVKRLVLQRDKQCQHCGNPHSLQIHHKTYLNRGNELYHLQDLITLCKSCHEDVHGKSKTGDKVLAKT